MKVLVALAIPFLAIGHSHADGYGTAVADCAGVTFTTAPGTRMIASVDDQPPGEAVDGRNTITMAFWPNTSHSWTFLVFLDGVPVDSGAGTIDGCEPDPTPIIEPPAIVDIGTPPDPPPPVTIAEPETVPAPWEGVKLAPPW